MSCIVNALHVELSGHGSSSEKRSLTESSGKAAMSSQDSIAPSRIDDLISSANSKTVDLEAERVSVVRQLEEVVNNLDAAIITEIKGYLDTTDVESSVIEWTCGYTSNTSARFVCRLPHQKGYLRLYLNDNDKCMIVGECYDSCDDWSHHEEVVSPHSHIVCQFIREAGILKRLRAPRGDGVEG